jgi:hypothetical protein
MSWSMDMRHLRTVAIGKVVENYYVEDYYGPYELLREAKDVREDRLSRKPSS